MILNKLDKLHSYSKPNSPIVGNVSAPVTLVPLPSVAGYGVEHLLLIAELKKRFKQQHREV